MMKHLLISVFIFLSLSVFSQNFNSITLDETEREIIDLINQYRAKNNMPELKLSASLCYVADVHAKDLHINKPHENCGSLNSWSNKGRWNRLCYNKSKTALKEMKNKPAELTSYKGQSIELVYFGSDNYSASEVLEAWKKNPQCNNLILNKQPYAATKWLAIGAGYFEGYLCVWFGPLEDIHSQVAHEVKTTQKEIIAQEKPIETIVKKEPEVVKEPVKVIEEKPVKEVVATIQPEISIQEEEIETQENIVVNFDESNSTTEYFDDFDDFEDVNFDVEKLPKLIDTEAETIEEPIVAIEKQVEPEPIVIVEKPTEVVEKPAVTQPTTITPTEIWHVIVLVGSDKTAIDNQVLKMQKLGYPNSTAIFDKTAKYPYRVSAGTFSNRDDADNLKSELIKKGYKDAWLLKK